MEKTSSYGEAESLQWGGRFDGCRRRSSDLVHAKDGWLGLKAVGSLPNIPAPVGQLDAAGVKKPN